MKRTVRFYRPATDYLSTEVEIDLPSDTSRETVIEQARCKLFQLADVNWELASEGQLEDIDDAMTEIEEA